MVDLLSLFTLAIFIAAEATSGATVGILLGSCCCINLISACLLRVTTYCASVYVDLVLAGDFGFEQTGIHVELHALGNSTLVVNHLILFEWLVAWVIPLRVLPVQAVANLGHVPHLLDQVVQVEHEDHLALSEALLDELLG